jgi:hypothetical protein
VWLPNRALAYVWRAFQAKDPAIELAAETPGGGKRLPPADPDKGRSLTLEEGETLLVSTRPTRPAAIRRVEIWHGDEVIGRAQPGRPLAWTPRRPGCYVLHALYEGPARARGAAHPVLVTVPALG